MLTKELNKSFLGLSKVRNETAPSILEFSLLEKNYLKLSEKKVLNGTLSSLSSTYSSSINFDPVTLNLSINTESVHIIKIIMDREGYNITLSGGIQGVPTLFEISNPGSYNLFWNNLRVENGENPALSISVGGGEPSKTILEVIKLGNFYYLIGIYRDNPAYTLEDLVNELNMTFDDSLFRIQGYIGGSLERFILKDLGLETITLGTITLSDNLEYNISGFSFALDIPSGLYNTFYKRFMVPIIDKLEKDTTKYYINKI